MELLNSKKRLLEIAAQYASAEEFKAKDLPKYLLARKHMLLSTAYPIVYTQAPIRGIYKLYKKEKVLFIGHSTIDLLEAVQEHKEAGIIPFTSYVYHNMSSDADIVVLSLYLVNYFRPSYNTNVSKNKLSFKIDNTYNTLGKTIVPVEA